MFISRVHKMVKKELSMKLKRNDFNCSIVAKNVLKQRLSSSHNLPETLVSMLTVSSQIGMP